ncbi:MAG: heme anaerobic degradation radical SAM methyltransferase ChuW/HutW [Deltaproteobacteria bacterium]|jgi:oxygen-independent coproporphyrinogen-3 oxidase|nr:heme anaerobic degradation radical SAM methyltransferase ChuW/HutW [Deltaproteobacteria bacterium]
MITEEALKAEMEEPITVVAAAGVTEAAALVPATEALSGVTPEATADGRATEVGAEGPNPKPMEFSFGQTGGGSGSSGPERFLARIGVGPGLAFAEKFTVHAGTTGETLLGEEALEAYGRVLGDIKPGPLGLYLHIPFCQNRCLYCGFVGQKPDNELIGRYVSAMEKEIESLGTTFAEKPGPVRTVYFGGGTPTIVAPQLLARLTSAIQKNFNLANDLEMTLEGRVSDLSPENVSGFLGAGFNRFSLGVQSFDTEIRKSLGRHGDRAKAMAYLANLIERRMAPVIIDLIYGLPGQSVSAFLEDLKTADEMGVDGLDTYQLNVFRGGELEKAVKSGRIKAPANLAEQAEFYLKAAEFMDSLKWRRLSLSHYARDTRERNVYNPWAKTRKNCLAFGAGAGGFIDGHATYRRPDVPAYLEMSQNRRFGPDFLTKPTGRESLQSFIVGQMEMGYLNIKRLTGTEGVNPEPIALLADNWHRAGLVRLNGDHMELTDPGRFWGVNLTQALVVTASEAMDQAVRKA